MRKNEKKVYPVIFKKIDDGYVVHVPDFEIETQGDSLLDAMNMARDAICITGISLEDDLGKILPEPSSPQKYKATKNDEVMLLIDVDFAAYRRKMSSRAVKKTLTLPCWLNEAAEEKGINFSAVLQDALKQELGLDESSIKKLRNKQSVTRLKTIDEDETT